LPEVCAMLPPPLLTSAPSRETFRDRTVERLVHNVRELATVDAVAIVTVDPAHDTVAQWAGWFGAKTLQSAVGAFGGGPLDQEAQGLVEAVLEEDGPLLLARLDAWEATPELLEFAVRELGPRRARSLWRSLRRASVVGCPLRSEDGQALGVLVVASLDRGRPPMTVLEVVSDLAALALDRARLVEDELLRAREEVELNRATEAVSSSLELEDVYGRVVAHAAELTAADSAQLTRLNTRSGELRRVAGVNAAGEAAGRGLDPGGVARVARTRRALLTRSVMHSPIQLGPRLYGVLSVSRADVERAFTRADLRLLSRLARHSAAAIANALDFERERRIARALTLGFVPHSLPELPGYESGLLYAPALGDPAGGDVYGAWRLPGGAVAVLVGDVAGKGVETAALSSMVRFFVEARSWDSDSPAAILDQANAMLLERLPEDTFVTAFLAILSSGAVCYCNAGHLPPLQVTGSAVQEVPGRGLPLGVESRPQYADHELLLAEGDLVFAYTDGLTEARSEGETFGDARLARLVEDEARAHAPEQLVRRVHDEIARWADGLTDDAVVLALRRTRSPAARSA
jgi:serine phosphatase RsbU (regulator of sigma subunit)